MQIRKIISLLLVMILPIFSFSQIYTIGPVLSWNFSSEHCKFSGGFEFGIHALPIITENNKEAFLSLELGLDFEKAKSRFYTEFKLIKYIPDIRIPVLYGISAGPVMEWGKDGKTTFGFQSTAYTWCIVGANFRYRRINGKNYFGPGMFFKIPFTFMKFSLG